MAAADRLCAEIETACAAADEECEPLEAGIGAALAFVNTRLSACDRERLTELGPELVAILDRPRIAA